MTSEEVAAQVIAQLEQARIEYLLVGAYSSNFYGVARSTNDADLVVAWKAGEAVSFCQSLGDEFVLDRQLLLEGFTGSVRNVLHHVPTGFDIELFRLTDDSHHRERFARRRRETINELKLDAWIPTAEDVVIQKLRWGRRKDLDDIVNVLIVSGATLDWDYVARWTKEHRTTDLLEQLKIEAGIE